MAFAAAAVYSLAGKSWEARGERVGVIEVRGFIADSANIVEGMRKFRNDPEVKAVVVHVLTPGGVVSPAQEIHDEVKRTAAVKPVVASFGPVAASGGYYLSAPATKIVANPGTITGSIGVILQFQEYRVLLDKIGLRAEAIKSGPFKDAGTPFRQMTEAERAVMQRVVNDIFDQFVSAVAEGRKMDKKRVLDLADGRIYTGRQAKELGLVDELGSYRDALELAARLGGMPPEEGDEVKIERWTKPRSGLMRFVLGEEADTAAALIDPLTAPPLRFVLPGW
jgi:protease-4